ncbi:MAG: hypothetical protein RIR51_841 [Bacteroidota bacterium]|jgi:hypothetical protein
MITDRKSNAKQFKKILFDVRIGTIICLIPYLIFVHLLFDENSKTIIIGDLEFAHKFHDNQVFIWSVLVSLIPLILTAILFFTITHAWRFSLLPLSGILFLSLMTNFSNTWEEIQFLLRIEGFIATIFFFGILFFLDSIIFEKYRGVRVEIRSKELLGEIVNNNFGKLNKKVEQVLESKNVDPLPKYLCRIYLLLELLNVKTSHKLSSVLNQNSKDKFQKSDYTSAFFILISTLMLLVYNLVPNSLEGISFYGFKIGSFGFNTFHTFIWYSFFRLALLLILIWSYLKIDLWWRWALLSPIFFYSFQFIEIFFNMRVDELGNIIFLGPILILVLFILIVIWKISSREFLANQYRDVIQEEFDLKINEMIKNEELKNTTSSSPQ